MQIGFAYLGFVLLWFFELPVKSGVSFYKVYVKGFCDLALYKCYSIHSQFRKDVESFKKKEKQIEKKNRMVFKKKEKFYRKVA